MQSRCGLLRKVALSMPNNTLVVVVYTVLGNIWLGTHPQGPASPPPYFYSPWKPAMGPLPFGKPSRSQGGHAEAQHLIPPANSQLMNADAQYYVLGRRVRKLAILNGQAEKFDAFQSKTWPPSSCAHPHSRQLSLPLGSRLAITSNSVFRSPSKGTKELWPLHDLAQHHEFSKLPTAPCSQSTINWDAPVSKVGIECNRRQRSLIVACLAYQLLIVSCRTSSLPWSHGSFKITKKEMRKLRVMDWQLLHPWKQAPEGGCSGSAFPCRGLSGMVASRSLLGPDGQPAAWSDLV